MAVDDQLAEAVFLHFFHGFAHGGHPVDGLDIRRHDFSDFNFGTFFIAVPRSLPSRFRVEIAARFLVKLTGRCNGFQYLAAQLLDNQEHEEVLVAGDFLSEKRFLGLQTLAARAGHDRDSGCSCCACRR